MGEPVDVAVLSLGTTPGLVRTDQALVDGLAELGVSCALYPVTIGRAGRLRRHPAVTDLIEALAARRSARAIDARAVVISTVTASFFYRPRVPYAVRFDATVALSRPGLSGAWQRLAERPALSGARLLLPLGDAAGQAAPAVAESVTLPVPMEERARSGGAPRRDIDAVTHARFPRRRGLELVCAAWAAAGGEQGGRRLLIGGLSAEQGRAWLERAGVAEPGGVEWVGMLDRERWLELVGRARMLVSGARWEGHGLAHLEALGLGTPLVTVPATGSYEALPLARSLAPELVADEISAAALARAIASGLALDDAALADYGRRASELLRPYRADVVRALLAERVLPALGIEVRSAPERSRVA